MSEITDKERMDTLEAYSRKQPLTLWCGDGAFPGGSAFGLSLLGGERTLREAVDQLIGGERERSK